MATAAASSRNYKEAINPTLRKAPATSTHLTFSHSHVLQDFNFQLSKPPKQTLNTATMSGNHSNNPNTSSNGGGYKPMTPQRCGPNPERTGEFAAGACGWLTGDVNGVVDKEQARGGGDMTSGGFAARAQAAGGKNANAGVGGGNDAGGQKK
jgi:hypothetical protein